MPTETTVVELQRTPSYALGTVGHLAVAVFHDAGTVAQLEAMDTLLRELAQKHGRAAMLTVITTLKASPSPEVRQRAVQLSDRRGSTTPSVLVLTATGLGAVLFRAFMGGLALVAPNSSSRRVVKSVADGVAYLGEELVGVGPSPHALTAAIEAFAARR